VRLGWTYTIFKDQNTIALCVGSFDLG